ncbi:MAG: hypothetical protein K2K97_04155 [Muribaculaceae bacterium]|nr:hypothetical protein [Muribaculaceae bacterium]
MGLDAIIATLQGSGCSPFFFTSAMQSMLFGEIGRHNQSEMMESNLEFREHIQKIRNQYSKERLEDQLLFRRESYELGRQYLIEQTLAQYESRKKMADFADFIDNYWPLASTPFAVLENRKDYLERKSVIPLNVLIAKTEATSSLRDTSLYGNFCESLISELQNKLHGITIEKSPWGKSCQSRISEAMNINYIMGGIPTLIIFPYKDGNTLGIETASWSFGRGFQSMNHTKLLQIENIDSEDATELALSAVKATIGMTRDAYILAEYHAPAVYPQLVDDKVLSVPVLRKHLSDHYNDMKRLVGSPEFKQLCSKEELQGIESSLNIKLLNA